MRITHVIYDLDGTLLDTEPFYIRTTNEIFARFGMQLPPAVRAMMMGRPTPVAVPLMIEHTGLPMTAEEFIHERYVALNALFPDALPTPGARELTAHLAAHRIPQAVATSSSRESLEHKLTNHAAWFDAFETVVIADEVEHGKPAPDIFLEAARRMNADPTTCLVFEDAPIGVEAALAAYPDPVAGKLAVIGPAAQRRLAESEIARGFLEGKQVVVVAHFSRFPWIGAGMLAVARRADAPW